VVKSYADSRQRQEGRKTAVLGSFRPRLVTNFPQGKYTMYLPRGFSRRFSGLAPLLVSASEVG